LPTQRGLECPPLARWRGNKGGILAIAVSSLSSCGFPVHAAAEIGVLYPPQWIFFKIFSPLTAFTWLLLGHYLLAGVCVILLQFERRITGLAAVFSAATFTFSGFLVTHLIHTSIVCAAAWLPLIVYALLRWLKTRQLVYLLLAGSALAMQFLASHPQIAIITAFAGVALLGFGKGDIASYPQLRKRVQAALLFLLVGYGLAAMQLLPTFEAALFSTRGEALSQAFRFQGALQPQLLITLLFPYFFGIVTPSDVSGYGFVSPLYWGQGGAFWEMCGYVGIFALLLSVYPLIWPDSRKRSKPLYFLGILALLLALGKFGGLYYLFQLFPGASRLRFPSRFLLLWTLVVSLLAGDGLKLLLQQEVKRFQGRRLSLILVYGAACLLILFLCIHSIIDQYQEPIRKIAVNWTNTHIINQPGHHLPAERYYQKVDQALDGIFAATDIRRQQCWFPFLLIFGSLGVIMVTWQVPARFRLILVGSLCVIQLVDLGSFSITYNQPIRKSVILEKPLSVQYLEHDQDQYRILSLDRRGTEENELLKPCFNVTYDIPSLFTPGPLTNRNFHRWLRVTGAGVIPFDLDEKKELILKNLPFLSAFTIKYILTEKPIFNDPRLELVDHKKICIYRNQTCLAQAVLLPHVHHVPTETKNIPQYIVEHKLDLSQTAVLPHSDVSSELSTSENLNIVPGELSFIQNLDHLCQMVVYARQACILQRADLNFPGWEATIDTQPVPLHTSAGLFQAVRIDPGLHEVQYVFKPFSFTVGLFLSLCALAGCITLAIVRKGLIVPWAELRAAVKL